MPTRSARPESHTAEVAWSSLNPRATALRAAATSYAKRFATQWWAYDASAARPDRFVPDDVLGRVAPFLDGRALDQASDRVASAQTWAQIVANRQRAVPSGLDAYVPTVWDSTIVGSGRKKIPAGAVMVTVTGSTHVHWDGGQAINTGLAITVDVRCQPPPRAGRTASCVIDYLFPRVAR